ncbi:Dimethylaniline monooxygenase [N-oxide-forming] 4 [Mactra antiquata]
MKVTVANISKEIMAYSDFPPLAVYPIFMHNTHLKDYLHRYADNFNLRKHIHLNTKVIQITETEDHKTSGQWCVKYQNIQDNKVTSEVFDAVMVCTGVFGKPVMPTFQGMETFQGEIIHTREYKTSKNFEGKTTLVVGLGNSAVDAAIDISEVAKQVYISSRNGSWIFGRLGPGGLPGDMLMLSRVGFYLLKKFPSLLNKLAMSQCSKKLNHKLFGLNPKFSPLQSNSTVNDMLGYKLLTGEIKMKPGVKQICGHCVEFVDGSKIDGIDSIVCGTGYLPDFPFLDSGVIDVDKSNMYLGMFPPDRKVHTLVVIGCFRQKGPIIPVTEMQSRLATMVFKGSVTLPDSKIMWEYIRRNKEDSNKYRIPTLTGVTQVDYLPYMDELAAIIGVKPNLVKLVFQDPTLAKQCIFGPGTSYQFRLTGPHQWAGARDAIFTQWDRTLAPLTSDWKSAVSRPRRNPLKLLVMILSIVSIGYAVYRSYGSYLRNLLYLE